MQLLMRVVFTFLLKGAWWIYQEDTLYLPPHSSPVYCEFIQNSIFATKTTKYFERIMGYKKILEINQLTFYLQKGSVCDKHALKNNINTG